MADADAARFAAALQPYRPTEAASGIVGFAHVSFSRFSLTNVT
jgi:hypothetical protein